MQVIKDESQYSMIDWWKKVLLDNYANFEGRARRAEFWNFVLFNFLLQLTVLILSIIFIFLGGFLLWGLLGLYNLAIFIPNLAVIVRRLHDTGKSGWLYFIAFIPLGGILLIVFLALEGDRGANKYGPDPKQLGRSQIEQIGKEF